MRVKAEFQVLDEPVRLVGATGMTAHTSLTGPETGLTSSSADNTNSAIKDDSIIKAKDQDRRVPLMSYLKDPCRGAERNV